MWSYLVIFKDGDGEMAVKVQAEDAAEALKRFIERRPILIPLTVTYLSGSEDLTTVFSVREKTHYYLDAEKQYT